MKISIVNEAEIKTRGPRQSDLFDTLDEFAKTGWKACKIEDYPHKTANICAQAFRAAIKRYRKFNIKVSVRKDNVYLINTAID